LEPALKWLSVYMRARQLQVELRVDADETGIDIDMRVLVFKVIRELLRNVIKHSGVQAAMVTITRAPDELRAVVEDRGVGFGVAAEFIRAARARIRAVERRRSRAGRRR